MKMIEKLCLILIFVGLTSVTVVQATQLSGKATVASGAVAGVEVLAYPADAVLFDPSAAHVSAPTKSDGLFSLTLPEGQYYLLARGVQLFAYYGRNPVAVSGEGLENVNLLMTPDPLPGPTGDASIDSGVVGFVSLDGKPVENAIVTVYPDLSSQLKGMGLAMAAPTGAQGYFELPLFSGSYYLVVRVRKDGQMAGPLRAGDLFGYLPANPLVLKDGDVARVHIPLIAVPEKVSRHSANLFGNTRISGQILDQKGTPVPGIQVLLYDDPVMLNRPLFVSQQTDADGRYQISFPEGGRYYLAARNELGGTPAPGELYGRYQGSPDHSIFIESGKVLEDVKIVVEEVY